MSIYEQIRQQFPNPVKNTPGRLMPPDTYCVGGALSAFMGGSMSHYFGVPQGLLERDSQARAAAIALTEDATLELEDRVASGEVAVIPAGNFPGPQALAGVLREANPYLTPELSLALAERIIRKNDTGNMETAWGLLEDALEWTPSWTRLDDERLRAASGSVPLATQETDPE